MRLVLANFGGKSAWYYARETWGGIVLPEDYESCIYKIENKNNSKCYVGHTTQKPYVRWYEHLRDLILNRHLSVILQNSWNKYGMAAFEFSVIEFCSTAQRLEREQFWIDRVDTVYNIAKVAGSTLGTKRTEEDRKKFSEIQKAAGNVYKYLHTEAAQAKHKQIVASVPYRKKMSALMKGRPKSQETKERMSKAWELRKASGWKPAFTNETRAKISAAGKGRKKSPEHQAKINASLAATRARKAAEGLKYHEQK